MTRNASIWWTVMRVPAGGRAPAAVLFAGPAAIEVP
jgi:hypothetical protein